jgi:hypothetical protein
VIELVAFFFIEFGRARRKVSEYLVGHTIGF